MTIYFYVGFRSLPGQSVALKLALHDREKGSDTTEIPLQYLDETYWRLVLNTTDYELADEIEYSYIFRDPAKHEEVEFCKNSIVNLKKVDAKVLNIVDEWRDDTVYEDVFTSIPFTTVLSQGKEKVKVTDTKKPTHIIKVKSPALQQGKVLCLC